MLRARADGERKAERRFRKKPIHPPRSALGPSAEIFASQQRVRGTILTTAQNSATPPAAVPGAATSGPVKRAAARLVESPRAALENRQRSACARHRWLSSDSGAVCLRNQAGAGGPAPRTSCCDAVNQC